MATDMAGVWHRPPVPHTPGLLNGIQLESQPPKERFSHSTLNLVGLLTDLDALTIEFGWKFWFVMVYDAGRVEMAASMARN